MFLVVRKTLKRKLKKSSSRPGKALTTGFINTALNDFSKLKGGGLVKQKEELPKRDMRSLGVTMGLSLHDCNHFQNVSER